MLSKNEIKDIQSLRHKKFRTETGLFIAEGPKIVSELLQLAPKHVVKVIATKEWIEKNEPLTSSFPVEAVDTKGLEKVSQLQTPNGVVAILKQFSSQPPEASGNFIIYLDAIQDPGNFGTIVRTADWFGIKNIVCGEGCADLYNSKVIQSTMASVGRVNVFYEENNGWIQMQNAPMYAAVLNGKSLYSTPKTAEGILLIGNESKGLSAELLSMAQHQITIPRIGEAESLNAAVATGIILSYLVG